MNDMHLLVSLPYLISLMHRHGLFKIENVLSLQSYVSSRITVSMQVMVVFLKVICVNIIHNSVCNSCLTFLFNRY